MLHAQGLSYWAGCRGGFRFMMNLLLAAAEWSTEYGCHDLICSAT